MSETIYTFRVLEGKTVTVRKAAEVGTGDYVGTLRSGEQFKGVIVTNTPQELWVKLIDKFPGAFAAVRYTSPGGSPKTFALTIGENAPTPEDPEDPPSNPTPIPVDADVHLTIRAGVIVGVTVDGETWQKTESFG
jgi:hypothetical protein